MESDSGSLESQVHLIPCKISYDGSAPIATYFKPSNGTAHFRGKELKSKVFALPEGSTGCCVVRSNKKVSVSGSFTSITAWQHDVAPNNSVMADYFNAMDVANALHSTN